MSVKAAVAFLCIGAGVGWLVGLSVSPVVAAVLGAVLPVVALVVGAAAGVRLKADDPDTPRVQPWPLALLVIAMALSASAAIPVREGGLLLPKSVRAARAAAAKGSSQGALAAGANAPREAYAAGLFGGRAPADCQRLRGESGAGLRAAYRTADDSLFRRLGAEIEDPGLLAQLREILCRS